MDAHDMARALRTRRKTLEVTQRDLAQIAGVSLHTVIDLESGNANPTLEVLNKILNTLGLDMEIKTKEPGRTIGR